MVKTLVEAGFLNSYNIERLFNDCNDIVFALGGAADFTFITLGKVKADTARPYAGM
jgi:hypothetical protein